MELICYFSGFECKAAVCESKIRQIITVIGKSGDFLNKKQDYESLV
jgi:hypothetical protein